MIGKIKCLFGFHPKKDGKIKTRRIEINEKKNKPPERYLEVKESCLHCCKIKKTAYFQDAGIN